MSTGRQLRQKRSRACSTAPMDVRLSAGVLRRRRDVALLRAQLRARFLLRPRLRRSCWQFQVDNFGRGGLGGDPIVGLARAVGRNNATFQPAPDGASPTISMFLWTVSVAGAAISTATDRSISTAIKISTSCSTSTTTASAIGSIPLSAATKRTRSAKAAATSSPTASTATPCWLRTPTRAGCAASTARHTAIGAACSASSAIPTTTARSGQRSVGRPRAISRRQRPRQHGVGHQRGAPALRRRARAVPARTHHARHAGRDPAGGHATQPLGVG